MKISQQIFESYKGSLLQISIDNNNLSGLFLCRLSAKNALRRQSKNTPKMHFFSSCLQHIEKRITIIKRQLWVRSLTHYSPKIYGHWAEHTAGFNISLNGRIWLSDNKAIKSDKENDQVVMLPSHENLINGKGLNKTIYSGLYCFFPNELPAIYLYSECESVLNSLMKNALLSLVDVHKINIDTVVYSNMSKQKLFSLSDI